MRSGVEVRPIRPQDLDDVVALCLRARAEAWTGAQVCSGDADTVARHVGALTSAPGATLLVARDTDGVVGILLGRLLGPNVFTDDVNLAVEAVYVDPRQRRRGVGHALMQSAVEIALAAGAENVYAAPLPGARGVQRFFVRLGFAPAASHRVMAVAALHRRLAAEGARRRGPRGGLEEVIARRRQSRGESGSAALFAAPRGAISRHVSRAVQTRRPLESSTTIS